MPRSAGRRVARSHRLLPHTADAGLKATAPDLPGLFEEAALAVAELTSDGAAEAAASTGAAVEPDGPGTVDLVARETLALVAPDLPALAFAWLDELIGLIDARASAVAGTEVRSVEAMADGWRMAAQVRLMPFDGRRVRRRHDAKSATYHGLVVEAVAGGWRLVAYVDV